MIKVRIRFAIIIIKFVIVIVSSLALSPRTQAQSATPGNAIILGGTTNDFVILTNLAGFPSNTLTAEFWMRSTQTGQVGLLSYAAGNHDNELLIFNATNLQVYVGQAAAPNSGVSVVDNNWHHVAASWTNSGILKLYVDGNQVMSQNSVSAGAI